MSEDIGSPIGDFIKAFLGEAGKTLKELGFETCSKEESEIQIELYATEVREGSGALKIHVFSLGGKAENTNAQKMTICAKKINDVKDKQNQALIAEAEVKIAMANKIKKRTQMEPYIC